MIKSFSYHFRVESAVDLTKPKVYFDRVVEDNEGNVDINVVFNALRMLFNSDIFRITVDTYGA